MSHCGSQQPLSVASISFYPVPFNPSTFTPFQSSLRLLSFKLLRSHYTQTAATTVSPFPSITSVQPPTSSTTHSLQVRSALIETNDAGSALPTPPSLVLSLARLPLSTSASKRGGSLWLSKQLFEELSLFTAAAPESTKIDGLLVLRSGTLSPGLANSSTPGNGFPGNGDIHSALFEMLSCNLSTSHTPYPSNTDDDRSVRAPSAELSFGLFPSFTSVRTTSKSAGTSVSLTATLSLSLCASLTSGAGNTIDEGPAWRLRQHDIVFVCHNNLCSSMFLYAPGVLHCCRYGVVNCRVFISEKVLLVKCCEVLDVELQRHSRHPCMVLKLSLSLRRSLNREPRPLHWSFKFTMASDERLCSSSTSSLRGKMVQFSLTLAFFLLSCFAYTGGCIRSMRFVFKTPGAP